jgi:serine phosphatase RsbU (regulator of sigma subunit)
MGPVESTLAHTPLFRELPEGERSRLAKRLTVTEIPCGEALFREGDPGDRLYVLLRGHVEIIKAYGTPEESVLGIHGEGEFIGEMSLLNRNGARTATARAKETTRCLEIPFAEFNALLARYPTLAYPLASMLSQRMTAAADDVIHTLQEKNRQLEQAYHELQAVQAQLVEKEKLERELQLAGEIQHSILPVELPRLPGYDFGALMVPARVVGGDFFSLFTLCQDRVSVVVGDVMGKGIPAAIFMAQTHALLRAIAHPELSPGETLRRVNRLLLQMNDQGLFVTMLYGVLHGPTGEFGYARAGHELPLLLSPDGDARFAPMGDGMPLGILDDSPLDENTLTFSPGELMLLYSDGVTDSSDGMGHRFDQPALIDTVRGALRQSARGICQSVLQTVTDFQRGAPRFDDITLLAVRRDAHRDRERLGNARPTGQPHWLRKCRTVTSPPHLG